MPHPKHSNDPTFVANQTPHLRTRTQPKKKVPEPWEVPCYDPMKIRFHEAEYHVNEAIRDDPLALFILFFTDDIFSTLCSSTNANAVKKRAIELSEHSRPWYDSTPKELRAFVACHLYFGLHPEASIDIYWSQKYRNPGHIIIKDHLSLIRYEQLERYFHISPLCEVYQEVFEKLEPLNQHLLDVSKELYTPGTHVAIDEAMAKYTGRSKHTIELPNKPIPEGYKIWVLAHQGYCSHWLFHTKWKQQGPLLLDVKFISLSTLLLSNKHRESRC